MTVAASDALHHIPRSPHSVQRLVQDAEYVCRVAVAGMVGVLHGAGGEFHELSLEPTLADWLTSFDKVAKRCRQAGFDTRDMQRAFSEFQNSLREAFSLGPDPGRPLVQVRNRLAHGVFNPDAGAGGLAEACPDFAVFLQAVEGWLDRHGCTGETVEPLIRRCGSRWESFVGVRNGIVRYAPVSGHELITFGSSTELERLVPLLAMEQTDDAVRVVGRGDEIQSLIAQTTGLEPGSALWLRGNAGHGKSALLRAVIEALTGAGSPPLDYAFSRHDVSKDLRDLRRSIFGQIDGLPAAVHPTIRPDEEVLLARLAAVNPVVVVDGLDEVLATANDSERRKEVGRLLRLVRAGGRWLLAGRPDPWLVEAIGEQVGNPFPAGLTGLPEDALATIIRDRVSAPIRDALEIGGASQGSVLHALAERCGGIPLHARRVAALLDDCRDVADVRAMAARLANDPGQLGLARIHSEILSRFVSEHAIVGPRLLGMLATLPVPPRADDLAALCLPASAGGAELVGRALASLEPILKTQQQEGARTWALDHETLGFHLRSVPPWTAATADALRQMAMLACVPSHWPDAMADYMSRFGLRAVAREFGTKRAASLLLDREYVAARLDQPNPTGAVADLIDDISSIRDNVGDLSRRRLDKALDVLQSVRLCAAWGTVPPREVWRRRYSPADEPIRAELQRTDLPAPTPGEMLIPHDGLDGSYLAVMPDGSIVTPLAWASGNVGVMDPATGLARVWLSELDPDEDYTGIAPLDSRYVVLGAEPPGVWDTRTGACISRFPVQTGTINRLLVVTPELVVLMEARAEEDLDLLHVWRWRDNTLATYDLVRNWEGVDKSSIRRVPLLAIGDDRVAVPTFDGSAYHLFEPALGSFVTWTDEERAELEKQLLIDHAATPDGMATVEQGRILWPDGARSTEPLLGAENWYLGATENYLYIDSREGLAVWTIEGRRRLAQVPDHWDRDGYRIGVATPIRGDRLLLVHSEAFRVLDLRRLCESFDDNRVHTAVRKVTARPLGARVVAVWGPMISDANFPTDGFDMPGLGLTVARPERPSPGNWPEVILTYGSTEVWRFSTENEAIGCAAASGALSAHSLQRVVACVAAGTQAHTVLDAPVTALGVLGDHVVAATASSVRLLDASLQEVRRWESLPGPPTTLYVLEGTGRLIADGWGRGTGRHTAVLDLAETAPLVWDIATPREVTVSDGPSQGTYRLEAEIPLEFSLVETVERSVRENEELLRLWTSREQHSSRRTVSHLDLAPSSRDIDRSAQGR